MLIKKTTKEIQLELKKKKERELKSPQVKSIIYLLFTWISGLENGEKILYFCLVDKELSENQWLC